MNEHQKNDLMKMLLIQFEMKEQAASKDMVRYMINELSAYGFDQVMNALQKLGKESVFKVNLAEIIKRIDDGRPSAQIAWTECPKSEFESKVLTTEQNQAFCEVINQYDSGDKVGAKFAFIERYNQLIDESKAKANPVTYCLASGFDKQGRKDAVYEAVQSGKLLKKTACHMLGYEFDNQVLALDSPTEPAIMIEHEQSDDIGINKLAKSLRINR